MNSFLQRCIGLSLVCFLLISQVYALGEAHSSGENELNNAAASCFIAPIMDCAPVYFGCPSDGLDPDVTGWSTAEPGSPDCPEPIVTYSDQYLQNSPCNMVVKRTWTAEYPDDASPWLIATCTQTIFLEDTDAPEYSWCPEDITIDLSLNDCDYTATWSEPEASDNCGVVSVLQSHYPGDEFELGDTQVDYMALDACDLFDVCSFTVSVIGSCCTAAPAISCPSDLTICVGDSFYPNDLGPATAEPGSAECGTPIITSSDDIQGLADGNCMDAKIITRTWTATDPDNPDLFSTCEQIITIDDETLPVFANVPADITVTADPAEGCLIAVNWTAPTASDNCGLSSVNSNYAPGALFNQGVTQIEYTALDECGLTYTASFTITVECSCGSAPVINCPEIYVSCPGTAYGPSLAGEPEVIVGMDCNEAIISYEDILISSGPCDGQAKYQRTWTATDPDDSSLSSSCIQAINLQDTDQPSFANCPADITVIGGGAGCTVPVNWVAPVASDNCALASVVSNYNSGHLFSEGQTTVIYTATDACGNIETCDFIVTVDCQCQEAPVLACPAKFTACPGTNTDPSTTGYPSVLTGSGCADPVVTYTDVILSSGPCDGAKKIRRMWRAEDPNNPALFDDCKQIIKLEDTQDPWFGQVPGNITVNGEGYDCQIPVSWTPPNAYDNCGLYDVSSTHEPGDLFSNGNTTVSYTATDQCGNTKTYSFVVSVICSCDNPPLLNCPPMFVGCPGTWTDPERTGTPTLVPGTGCGPTVISYTDKILTQGPCDGAIKIRRLWKVTDTEFGLSTTCKQIIKLRDIKAPNYWTAPDDIYMEADGQSCSAVVNWEEPVIDDDCGVNTISSSHQSGDTFDEGITTVTYTATDHCGNQSVHTFDINISCVCNTPPMVSCPADYFGCPNVDISPEFTGFATGSSEAGCDPPVITYADVELSNGPCDGQLHIKRTWTASDPNDASLYGSCLQFITLEDNQAPSIVGPGDITVSGDDCPVVATWPSPTYNDNCGIASTSSSHNSGDEFELGVTTVTLTATDNCGNSSNYTFDITVTCLNSGICSMPPVIAECASDITICPDGSTDPSHTGYTIAEAADQNCGEPIITYTDLILSTEGCGSAHLIERTWFATDPDDENLVASCTQMISLEDEVAPVITNCPHDITINGNDWCDISVPWAEASASDNCGLASFSSDYENGAIFSEGTTTVTYTAIDDCDNIETCSFTITILCNDVPGCDNPPNIVCPSDITLCAGVAYGPSITGQATATPGDDDCSYPMVNYTDVIISTGPCAGAKVVERTWTATDPDNSSLASSCTQLITLEDNELPEIWDCPADIYMSTASDDCTKAISWIVPMFTDDCSAVTLSSNYEPGDVFSVGTTTVTYTGTDACGNEAVCSFDVILECTTVGCVNPPNIVCPSNAYLCTTTGYGPNVTGYATATPYSDECWPPILEYNDMIVSTGPCFGAKEIIRTWTATDPDDYDLVSTCTQLITLGDAASPEIWECPADITVGSTSTPVYWTAPSATDECDLVSFTSSHPNGSFFPVGTSTVTYTAEDGCGNVSVCEFTVTVGGTPTTFECQEDINVDCGPGGGSYVTWEEPVFESDCNDCGGGVIPGFMFMGTYNGHQYYCSTSPATWTNAQSICEQNGGHLACIGSEGENAFLANILTIQSAYIGLHDVNQEGQFEWVCNEELGYTNWYPGQPNNYNGAQDYVEMLSDGTWNDQYASTILEYIMEIPCDHVTQIGGPSSGSFFYEGCTTITYKADDGCSPVQTCSFEVCVDPSININCPEDVTVSCPNNNGMTVTWQTPEATSCCANCSGGDYIPGFVYMGEHNGHYYYCSTAPASWNTAKSVCTANGGYLAAINDASENAFLANILTIQSAYIGLSDEATEGVFQWCNNEPVNYTNWYPGQPNNYNGSQDYVEMLSDGTWNDQYNTTSLEYIMEIPGCVHVTQIAGPPSGSVFQPGTTTTISYQASDDCGNWTTCSFDLTVIQSDCNSGGLNSGVSWIENVQFANLNNTSWDDGGYGDYTDQCATISPNSNVYVSLTPGFPNSNYHAYWMIWIDFNMDGDYLDAGEFVAYGNGTGNINGYINMPSTLWNGETTMRVAMKIGSYPTSPCEVFPYGETEDYCIWVTGAGDLTEEDTNTRETAADAIELFSEAGLEANKSMKAFPNPADQFVTITIDSGNSKIESVQIMNMEGKRIENGLLEDGNLVKLNVSQYVNGMYLIKTSFEDGETITERFSVQH